MRTQAIQKNVFDQKLPAVAAMPEYNLELPKKLSTAERSELLECEATIRKGLETFEETADALYRVKHKLLFRETHGTFEAYCQDKWKIGARRGRQLAASAEVVANIREIADKPTPVKKPVPADLEERIKTVTNSSLVGQKASVQLFCSRFGWEFIEAGKVWDEMCDRGLIENFTVFAMSEAEAEEIESKERKPLPLPTSERQTRALASLPKEEQQEVWKEAVRSAPGGQVTGKHVERVIEERRAPALPGIQIKPKEEPLELLAVASELFSAAKKYLSARRFEDLNSNDRAYSALLAMADWHVKAVKRYKVEIEELKASKEDRDKKIRFPKPNKHGVYDFSDAELIRFDTKHTFAKIHLLQMEKGWVEATHWETATGSAGGPLSAKHGVWKTRAMALYSAVRSLRASFKRIAAGRDGSVNHASKKPDAKKALTWLKGVK